MWFAILGSAMALESGGYAELRVPILGEWKGSLGRLSSD